MPSNQDLPKKIIPRHPLSLIFLSSCLFIFIFSSIFSYIQYTGINNINPDAPGQPAIDNGCKITGCNGEICQNAAAEDGFSICIYKEEFACYKSARCEVQSNGTCGWTQTSELKACLEENKTK